MSRNTASAPFRPSRRAPRGGRTVEIPPRCGPPSHGRNAISTRKQRGAGRTRPQQPEMALQPWEGDLQRGVTGMDAGNETTIEEVGAKWLDG